MLFSSLASPVRHKPLFFLVALTASLPGCTDIQRNPDTASDVVTAPLKALRNGLDNLDCATGRGPGYTKISDFKPIKGCVETERAERTAREYYRQKEHNEVASVFGAIGSLYLAAMIDSGTRMMSTSQTDEAKMRAVRSQKTEIIEGIDKQTKLLQRVSEQIDVMLALSDEERPAANTPHCAKDIYTGMQQINADFVTLDADVENHQRNIAGYKRHLQNTSDGRTLSVLQTASQIYKTGATDRVDNPSQVFSSMRSSHRDDARTAALFDEMQASDARLQELLNRFETNRLEFLRVNDLCAA